MMVAQNAPYINPKEALINFHILNPKKHRHSPFVGKTINLKVEQNGEEL